MNSSFQEHKTIVVSVADGVLASAGTIRTSSRVQITTLILAFPDATQVILKADTPSRIAQRATNSLVASSHEIASFHGSKILAEGGNVVDAAIATSALLCVTQNHNCGLGGDLFALIKYQGKVYDLNGSGRASQNAKINFYRDEMKLTKIPVIGPLAAPTVPGIVHAWGELHSRFGSIELKKLLEPATHYAKRGFPVTANYSKAIKDAVRVLGGFRGWADIFAPAGKVPAEGSILKQNDLANTLEQIANEGVGTFYAGNLSEKILKGVKNQRGLLTGNDLSRHTSTWQDPVKCTYRGTTVYETAPNSQASTVLLWLNMLEEYDMEKLSADSPKVLEIMLDTCLRAYEQRARQIGDHELTEEFTSKQFAKELLAQNARFVRKTKGKQNLGDTTHFCVGSANGDCASVIQSNYMGFGSGVVPDGTGFVLHNRGSYFTLDERHHNALRPGKRTFHTLCASIGEMSNETSFTIGSMGGDVQPQIYVQLMTKVLDCKMDPQRAIDSPRWVVPFTIYERPSIVMFEPSFEVGSSSARKIAKKLRLSYKELDSFSSQMGHAQAILFNKGCLSGGADPRGDGAVVGF